MRSTLLISIALVLLLPLSAGATPFNFGFNWEGDVTSVTIPGGDPVTIQVGDYVTGSVRFTGDTESDVVQVVVGIYIIDALHAFNTGEPTSFGFASGTLSVTEDFIPNPFAFFNAPPYGPNPGPLVGTLIFSAPSLLSLNCFGCLPTAGHGSWTWGNGGYALEADFDHFWVVPDVASTLQLFGIGLIGLGVLRRRLV